jgi:uncharacterized protein YybS (DUF2232 family)
MVEMLERRQPFERIVLVAAAATVVATAIGLIAMTGSPQALAASVHKAISGALDRSQNFYQMLGMGWSGEENDARTKLIDLTVRLSPAFTTVSIALMVLANLGLFWRWLGKERLTYTLFAGLTRWRTPEWMIWLFLATGFGLFVPIQPLRDFALDAFICVAAIYFCHGLSIMAFYFQMLAMPMAARGIIYFIAFVQPVLAALVCAVGVFDMWLDLRRLKPSSPEAGGFGDLL